MLDTSNLKPKALIMGILNVTPDSFSDGGKYTDLDSAIKHANYLIDHGVNIIDIGGESTRPSAELISETEELKRVLPIIKKLRKIYPFSNDNGQWTIDSWKELSNIHCSKSRVLISIDTYKSTVARQALDAGANIINDVSGLTMDSHMLKVAVEYQCPIIIMHHRGIPATKPEIKDQKSATNTEQEADSTLNSHTSVIKEIKEWLKKQTKYAIKNGVKKGNIIIDPGIGFGKTPEEDFFIINNINELKDLGFKVLIGASKKSFAKKAFINTSYESSLAMINNIIAKSQIDIVRTH